MDEISVRRNLEEIRARLAVLEEEREVLINLVKGYEGWLRLNSGNGGGQLSFSIPARRYGPKGKQSIRTAVLSVLQDAHGQPIHAKEILRRVQALGANTEAKDPAAIIDLTAYSLKRSGNPIEKTAPRTWRWAGED